MLKVNDPYISVLLPLILVLESDTVPLRVAEYPEAVKVAWTVWASRVPVAFPPLPEEEDPVPERLSPSWIMLIVI